MVKKIVLEINCNDSGSGPEPEGLRQQLISANEEMLKTVTKYKNKITPFYNNKTWDKFKKLSNEYELIFTTPNTKSNVAIYNPVSRSFFKMWEMLHDFTNDIVTQPNTEKGATTAMKCMFLAEGPGGFLEAVMKYRNNASDQYYGVTLRPENKSIPEWKLKRFDSSCITTLYGEDNTGDLYNLRNTHFIAKQLGEHSMDIVTADGGFDFSSDFNNQEDLSIKLIRCETYCAFHLLKENGTYILKIYDMFHHNTLNLLAILKACFTKMYFIKPLTSRPANSEKYVLCTGFNVTEAMTYVPLLHTMITKRSSSPGKKFTYETMDISLLHKIVMYNIYYTSRQVYYIQRTIDYINAFESMTHQLRTTKHDEVIKRNHEKCKNWCIKYNVQYNSQCNVQY